MTAALVPSASIAAVVVVVGGARSLLIDVGLRQPDVKAVVLSWLTPCGRTIVRGRPDATVTVERGHRPREVLSEDGRGFPLRGQSSSSRVAIGDCSSTIESPSLPAVVRHAPVALLGDVEVDLPGGAVIQRFTDRGPSHRLLMLAITTTTTRTLRPPPLTPSWWRTATPGTRLLGMSEAHRQRRCHHGATARASPRRAARGRRSAGTQPRRPLTVRHS